MKRNIICGFAGIGKSTMAKKVAGVIDLESTPFDKDWKRYVKVARHMADNGYTVLLSCHEGLRAELNVQGVKYTVAMPPEDDREAYLKRYKDRGNREDFVNMMDDKWSEFLGLYSWEDDVVVVHDYLINYI